MSSSLARVVVHVSQTDMAEAQARLEAVRRQLDRMRALYGAPEDRLEVLSTRDLELEGSWADAARWSPEGSA